MKINSSDKNLIENYLIASVDELVNMLKAVSQSSRLQILIMSLNKEMTFKELLESTKIQKTALNVHLNQLIEQKLLQKEERGVYRTTLLGEELIRVSALVLKDAHMKKVMETRQINILDYQKFGEKKMKKLISDEILYQPAWLSFLGSVSGVMKYYGLNMKVADVGGYSGYSFLLTMSDKFTCPSGPTAHPIEIWKEMHKGIESLGFSLNHWYENEDLTGDFTTNMFPETEFAVSSRDQERSKILFEKIKSVIDITNHPVIIWGIPVPEYGIVKGYNENSYLVSTFRHLNNEPETPIKYDALQAPGCLEFIALEPKETNSSKDKDINAIQRALKFSKGNYKPLDGYKVGPSAIETWITHLEQENEKYYPYHGNSYLGVCTHEAFALARDFLKNKNVNLKNTSLESAAKNYDDAAKKMAEFVKIFPFSMKGKVEKEKRKEAVELLKNVSLDIGYVLDNLQMVVG